MFKDDVDNMFATNSGAWDKQIAFSTEDVAIMLGLSKRKVTSLCLEGKLKAFKIGNAYRIKRHEVYQFIEDRIEETITF